jgi:serine/threonine protein kinase
MPWRLMVVDGADAKEFFPLPPAGAVTIGKTNRRGDILLHDLYVERNHCQVETDGGRVLLTNLSHGRGTFVNGEKIPHQRLLHEGDLLRVGNSYLRLEAIESPAQSEATAHEPDEHLPDLPPERLAELAGRWLGHYHLTDVLGTGHHGVVFRAVDANLDREVALKVLAADFPHDTDEAKHFSRIIRSVGALRHDHLVAWLGAGRAAPYTWIAQELIEGESLRHVLDDSRVSGRPGWRTALRLARDLAQALDFLHQQHQSHGNITPANILIRNEDRAARLNDLALGKALDGTLLQKRVLEAKLLAELPYLAPEQLEPEAFVDPQLADIYSLGVAVYARLNGGIPPFQGDTPEETIELIRSAPLPKPTQRQPSTPDHFVGIVLRMLARHQEERYQSVTHILADLAAFGESH